LIRDQAKHKIRALALGDIPAKHLNQSSGVRKHVLKAFDSAHVPNAQINVEVRCASEHEGHVRYT
jgi:hypothetical protein